MIPEIGDCYPYFGEDFLEARKIVKLEMEQHVWKSFGIEDKRLL